MLPDLHRKQWTFSLVYPCLLSLALVLGVLPALCEAQGRGPAQVQVLPVEQREIAPTVRLVGTVRPRVRTVVAAEVAGLVSEMPADVGDRVEKGSALCRLRELPKQLAHAEAEATLARLAAVLRERQAELSLAEFEKNRIGELWANQRCTEKELRVAEADLAASLSRAAQAEHAVAAQEAITAALADDLARTEILSPCDGYVVDKRTEIGSWVDRGGPVAEVVDLSVVRVRVSVPESMIPYCSPGEEVIVTVEALDKAFTGAITRLVPDADQQARTFPIEIDIPNPTCELKAGMFVRAAVPSGPKAMRLIVPKDAMVIRGPAPMIYVVRQAGDGQMAAPLPVRVVSEVRASVAVEAMGLATGDLVIVRGNEFMAGPGPVIALPMGGAPAQDSGEPPQGSPALPQAQGAPPQGHAAPGAPAAETDSHPDEEPVTHPASQSIQ